MDKILDARAGVAAIYYLVAGAEGEEFVEHLYGLIDGAHARIRAKVASTVLEHAACRNYARPLLLKRYFDIWIGLVVLEANVEARLVALDERVLEEERLAHRIRERVVHFRDPVDDLADPVALQRPGLTLPVAAHPAAEALRLADIDDLAAVVLHEVHAGPVGQVLEGRFELWGHARNCRFESPTRR